MRASTWTPPRHPSATPTPQTWALCWPSSPTRWFAPTRPTRTGSSSDPGWPARRYVSTVLVPMADNDPETGRMSADLLDLVDPPPAAFEQA